jgi:EpsI family protein
MRVRMREDSPDVTASSEQGPATPVGAAPAAARSTVATRRAWGIAGANLLLAIFAYRDLLTARPKTSLSLGVEGWFFEPSDTSPPVIALLVLWLVMRRWRRLSRLPVVAGAPLVTGLLLLGGIGAYVWAMRVAAPDLQAIALFCQVLGVANWLAGPAALRIVLVPAVVLLFAVPMPAPLLNHVVWQLQIWTADYSGFLLHALDLPALVSGDQILRSDNVFAIIETCSGLRSVETLTLLAVLMVDLFGRRGPHALLLIAAAPFVAFFINGFRALGLILNPHAGVAAVHNLQGIVMLLGGVLLLYGLDGLLGRLLPHRPSAPPPPHPPGAAQAAPALLTRRLLGVTGLLGLMIGLSLGIRPWRLDPLDLRLPAETVARDLDGWRAADLKTDWLFLGKAGFRQTINRRYTRGAEQVELFVGSAAIDRRHRSLLSPKTGLPGSGWIVESRGRDALERRVVDARVVRKGTRRLLVYHWYEGTRGLVRETTRSLLGLDASPLRRDEVLVVVRIATPVGREPTSREAAQARLAGFADLLDPSLRELSTPGGPDST